MKDNSFRVFSLASENRPVPGCTISSLLREDENLFCLCFSIADKTSISDEIYRYPHLYFNLEGSMDIRSEGKSHILHPGDFYIQKEETAHAVHALSDCVFVQIGLKKENIMNIAADNTGIFQLKDLVPYQEGKIINKEIITAAGTRLAVISLAKGCALPEHAAPNDALLFALDGEATFTKKGVAYDFKAGDNIAMHKGDRHSLTTKTDFKFALLLTEAE